MQASLARVAPNLFAQPFAPSRAGLAGATLSVMVDPLLPKAYVIAPGDMLKRQPVFASYQVTPLPDNGRRLEINEEGRVLAFELTAAQARALAAQLA